MLKRKAKIHMGIELRSVRGGNPTTDRLETIHWSICISNRSSIFPKSPSNPCDY